MTDLHDRLTKLHRHDGSAHPDLVSAARRDAVAALARARRRTGRRRVISAAGVAALIGGFALMFVLVLPRGGQAPEGRPPLTLPTAESSPLAVVQAYLSAIDRGDITEARALTDPHFTQMTDGSVDGWFEQRVRVRLVDAGAQEKFPPASKALPPSYSVVYVPVVLDVEQDQPVSLPNGRVQWGFTLVRASADEPWRIYDQGTG